MRRCTSLRSISVLVAVGVATSTSRACGCPDRRHAHLVRLGRLHAREADRAGGRAVHSELPSHLPVFLTSRGPGKLHAHLRRARRHRSHHAVRLSPRPLGGGTGQLQPGPLRPAGGVAVALAGAARRRDDGLPCGARAARSHLRPGQPAAGRLHERDRPHRQRHQRARLRRIRLPPTYPAIPSRARKPSTLSAMAPGCCSESPQPREHPDPLRAISEQIAATRPSLVATLVRPSPD